MDLLQTDGRVGTAPPGRPSTPGNRPGTCTSPLPRPRPAGDGPAPRARLALAAAPGDGAPAPLADRLDGLVRAGHRTIEVDLAEVPRLPLAALHLLLDTDRRLRARGGRLVLVNAGARVQRLLATSSTWHLAEGGPPATASSVGRGPGG